MALLGELSWYLQRTGQWQEALDLAAEVPEGQRTRAIAVVNTLVEIAVARGEVAEARRILTGLSELKDSADVQDRTGYLTLDSTVLRAEGRNEEALAAGGEAVASGEALGGGVSVDSKIAFSEELESALALGRLDVVESLLERVEAIPPGRRPPYLRAQAARFRSHLGAARGEQDGVEQGFKTAGALFREHGLVFYLAVTQVEHAEWLAGQGRSAEAEILLAEAGETFERLEATPWIERVALAVEAGVTA